MYFHQLHGLLPRAVNPLWNALSTCYYLYWTAGHSWLSPPQAAPSDSYLCSPGTRGDRESVGLLSSDGVEGPDILVVVVDGDDGDDVGLHDVLRPGSYLCGAQLFSLR